MEKHKVLERLLEELQRFLKLLDAEKLSGNATVQKSLLTDLLQSYTSNGSCGDEEYIYMNKVIVGNSKGPTDRDHRAETEANGKYAPGPQKSLPELPPPRSCVVGREPFPLPAVPSESPEGYYEEAQPYDTTINDDGEAVSSSYESYDEEEVSKGKSGAAQHQWPSTEASIELMKDARICAFLWRKKWLGQWAKQLCVIRDTRLLCYKSSKDQTPLLDVSLVGCSVIYKEKQPKRKEHKLKIIPQGGEAIVLGLQSKEQTEQWLKVIQEISPKSTEGSDVSDSPRLICTKGELGERYSVASESGSSTDSPAEALEARDVKKKYGAGLKFSNLMNIGKKKISSYDSPEKCVDTSGYLNVLVNNQWRSRWCLIKNGQLWVYQDKSKGKPAQQPVPLGGCLVLPDPSPEHLYSFRIQMDGEQLATLEAKSSAEMGHWLGLLLSQTGTKTDPEELAYDYVNSERISSIVNAAKTSMYLMQRRYSEPNTYTDSPPSDLPGSDDIYDDVPSTENEMEEGVENGGEVLTVEQDSKDRLYLDLVPVRSFLHTSSPGHTSPQSSAQPQGQQQPPPQPPPRDGSPTEAPAEEPQENAYQDVLPNEEQYESSQPCDTTPPPKADPEPPSYTSPRLHTQTQTQSQNQTKPQNQTPTQSQTPTPTQSQTKPQNQSPTQSQSQTQNQNQTPTLTQNQTKPQNQNPSQNQTQNQNQSQTLTPTPTQNQTQNQTKPQNQNQTKSQNQSQTKPQPSSFLSQETTKKANTSSSSSTHLQHHVASQTPQSPSTVRGRAASADKARVPVAACSGSIEVRLGKNRTEADVRRYTDERDCLEKEREEVKSSLATFRKERREAKEELSTCQDPAKQAILEACLKLKDEACREAERRRVEVELRLMEVKESLRKVEAGPFTLGTTVDSSLLDTTVSKAVPTFTPAPVPAALTSNGDTSPVNSATALKNRPLSIMASKGKVLAKAKEWEKKTTS
ncbi:actin filament-associated protein 1-like 2 [Alosa pseudoharengus]|uniref:actin filament-associated protein 1-like 2 n=1 Tax=Alosa pseudoharengus TaxID=34774 RepID=UPI003F8BBB1F